MTNSDIIWRAYNRYFLNLGGSKVPAPYRINLPYQDDRRKYGKWNPSKLTHDTNEIALKLKINLYNMTPDQIRQFMRDNMLGIDCSGFAYQTLNFLLNKLKKGNMKVNGFPTVSNTNVQTLGLDKFSIPINSLKEINPGDLIVFYNTGMGEAHIMVIAEKSDKEIQYIHSADSKINNGVQKGTIEIVDFDKSVAEQNWQTDPQLKVMLSADSSNGLRRIKALL